jgi:hypothetical protein
MIPFRVFIRWAFKLGIRQKLLHLAKNTKYLLKLKFRFPVSTRAINILSEASPHLQSNYPKNAYLSTR